ncbi:recombination-associated protein RdgC [Aeromonas popoffii]|uniref:recombination-associated protein RdgC n=1 Tax=Aeromonas popoffii TaxID=70856 RepID=UPI0005A6521A|nr:recombination-associated protein RdgC [Aeromonas popoffii]
MFSQIKTISLYRLTRQIDLVSEGAASQFLTTEFFPRMSSSASSIGWAPVMAKLTDGYFKDRGTMLEIAKADPENAATLPQPVFVHQCDGHILLRLVRDQAVVPPAQLQQLLASKVEAIEHQQGRALKKKEKEAIKEDILATLLPHAYTKRTSTHLWYQPSSGLMVVFAKGKAADDALALLRKTIGSLPVLPIAVKNPPEVTMTTWLQEGTIPAGFVLEDQAELRSAMQHGGIARFKQQDLMTDEVKNHLTKNDKLVTKLALNWGETVSFVLSDDLSITGVKWSDELMEKNDDINDEDPLAKMDADIALLAGEMSRFVPALIDALGGEESAPM